MQVDVFPIPVFIDTVELSKIKLADADFQETFISGVKSNFWSNPRLEPNSYDYLADIINKNLSETGKYVNPMIRSVWRNQYKATDTQEVHIHAKSQWSFIIYETVENSRTVFMNPAWKSIEQSVGDMCPSFSVNWRPKVKPGTIIIFPSFLEHYVMAGNVGTTIAGNIHMEYTNDV
jgi:hypothetical protein